MVGKKAIKRKKDPGASPGTLIHVGERKTDRVNVRVIDYDEQTFDEHAAEKVAELALFKEKATVTWINVGGLHETALIGEIGQVFGLHPLVLEDILNTRQRPKMENYEDYIFVVLKVLSVSEDGLGMSAAQVSFVLGSGYVLSFQEAESDLFDVVRERIQSRKGRICKMGPDYLLYALMDTVIDHYFVELEKIEEATERLEVAVFQDPDGSTLAEIQQLRSTLIQFRRLVRPLRETVNGLLRDEGELIAEKTGIFLRDAYDHTIQVIDTVEGFRDTVSGLLDVYLSSVSNRMNEVMKVLTIIATIFIPLTFIAGIYGMNFEYMPELAMVWAYPLVWLTMLVLALGMLWYFRKRGWL